MDLYVLYFAGLALFNAGLALYQRRRERARGSNEEKDSLSLPLAGSKEDASKFRKQYFTAYALVVAADWLQGPYMYALYKDEKNLDEATVAALFTIGFIAAAVSASFVGSLADRHGRRLACLAFCALYSLSCLSVLTDDIGTLLVGRAMGGVSTTLLYSCFETWMIAEYNERELSDCLNLGGVFSFAVVLSGVVAIVAGVVGEMLVWASGTKTSPFLAAVLCLAMAAVWISRNWTENYGSSDGESFSGLEGLRAIIRDKRILTLTLTSCAFEGSMYLFVFFWSPTLIAARTSTGTEVMPPFGLIFSSFMCAMMIGSSVFALLNTNSHDTRGPTRIMLAVLALASAALLTPTLMRDEQAVFWSFCLFELAVGLYWPTMSTIRSLVVEDAVRAKVYGIMRLPLNVFVVVALSLTQEGHGHRNRVFTFAGALLLATFWFVWRTLRD